MIIFEWIIGILVGAVVLSLLARRIGAPYPALLAIGGAGATHLFDVGRK